MAELEAIRAYTVDEFLPMLEALTDEDTHSLELIAGELIEVSPSKAKQTSSAAVLLVYMGSFVLQNHLGYLTGADGGFKLSEEDFFAPDAAFIAKEKLPAGQPKDDFYSAPPDLAVEVVSKSDKYSVHDKALRYLALGTRLVWVVFPHNKTIQVYRPAEKGALIEVLKPNDTLSGDDVLPGFSLALKDIFLD